MPHPLGRVLSKYLEPKQEPLQNNEANIKSSCKFSSIEKVIDTMSVKHKTKHSTR